MDALAVIDDAIGRRLDGHGHAIFLNFAQIIGCLGKIAFLLG